MPAHLFITAAQREYVFLFDFATATALMDVISPRLHEGEFIKLVAEPLAIDGGEPHHPGIKVCLLIRPDTEFALERWMTRQDESAYEGSLADAIKAIGMRMNDHLDAASELFFDEDNKL